MKESIQKELRAYICFDESPEDWCLLVLAKGRNRAKVIAAKSIFEWEYINITARLSLPIYDNISNGLERAYESNDDLPENVPPFYSDNYDLAQ